MTATKKKIRQPDAAGVQSIRAVVGKNLQGLLTNLGWGASEFHQRTGLSTHFIAGVLRGDQNISIDNLHVMAKALGIDVHQALNPRFEAPEKPLSLEMLKLSNRDVNGLRKNVAKVPDGPRPALAHHLRRLLAANALTVPALGEEIGVAPSTIQKCLKGTQNVTIDTLASIAEGLGVAPFVLLLPLST
jgi:transcriptional regulator with XRE-family HTH domain